MAYRSTRSVCMRIQSISSVPLAPCSAALGQVNNSLGEHLSYRRKVYGGLSVRQMGNKGIIRIQNKNQDIKPVTKEDIPEHFLVPKLGNLESIIEHDFSGKVTTFLRHLFTT